MNEINEIPVEISIKSYLNSGSFMSNPGIVLDNLKIPLNKSSFKNTFRNLVSDLEDEYLEDTTLPPVMNFYEPPADDILVKYYTFLGILYFLSGKLIFNQEVIFNNLYKNLIHSKYSIRNFYNDYLNESEEISNNSIDKLSDEILKYAPKLNNLLLVSYLKDEWRKLTSKFIFIIPDSERLIWSINHMETEVKNHKSLIRPNIKNYSNLYFDSHINFEKIVETYKFLFDESLEDEYQEFYHKCDCAFNCSDKDCDHCSRSLPSLRSIKSCLKETITESIGEDQIKEEVEKLIKNNLIIGTIDNNQLIINSIDKEITDYIKLINGFQNGEFMNQVNKMNYWNNKEDE